MNILLMLFSFVLFQDGDKKDKKNDDEVSTSRTAVKLSDNPYTVEIIDQNDIRKMQPRSTPDILKQTTSVLGQKTAYGQGSPFIRGWTGYNNLFLIDGIRLNNSVFRSGPNQYWSTVDPFIIRRIEIIKGPASSLYGSDAVGGTVNVITRSPFDVSPNKGFYPEASYRFASAENSHVERLQFAYIASEHVGFLGGFSLKDFNDFNGGGDFGKFDETGFNQTDGDFKMVWKKGYHELIFAYQKTFQDDVPRTHKTKFAEEFNGTSIGNELKRDQDQGRELIYIKHVDNKPWFLWDQSVLTLSLHSQDELRTRIKSNQSSDHQGFNVNTVADSLVLIKDSAIGKITYGLEYYYDVINSFTRNFDKNGKLTSHGIQGDVADNATYDSSGRFIQDEIKITPDILLIAGGRYDTFMADADHVNVGGKDQEFDDKWNALTGFVKSSYSVTPEAVVYGGVSQGFRAPNISDLTKLDDTSAVELPSLDLDPEHFTSFEVGARFKRNSFRAQAVYWYTLINDLIVQSPTGIFQGTTQVVRKDNVGDGYVNGIEGEAGYKITSDIEVYAKASHMFGRVKQLDEKKGFAEERAPLSRLMPDTIETGCDYAITDKIFWNNIATFVDKQDKLSLRDKNDTERIPPGGTPGYAVFSTGVTYLPTENLRLSLLIENLFDKAYRVHGSGTNEPGINAILSATVTF
ncbi:MAG: TonB-dependent receptor [Planctomycetes bacterium]|nr:TonB-dependent receptor [Planctomycetota bacterium]